MFVSCSFYIPPEHEPIRVGAVRWFRPPTQRFSHWEHQHVGIQKALRTQRKPSWTQCELLRIQSEPSQTQRELVEYSLGRRGLGSHWRCRFYVVCLVPNANKVSGGIRALRSVLGHIHEYTFCSFSNKIRIKCLGAKIYICESLQD